MADFAGRAIDFCIFTSDISKRDGRLHCLGEAHCVRCLWRKSQEPDCLAGTCSGPRSTLPDRTALTDPHSATRPIRLGQLGGHAAKAALAELPEGVKVDSVIFGCVRARSVFATPPKSDADLFPS